MKKILGILLLLSLYSCQESIEYTYPKVEIENYYKCQEYDIAPGDDYVAYCACVEENQLSFPTERVQHGSLIINIGELGDPFRFSQKHPLDEHFIDQFREIVADSANFSWGELGTQYTCYIIEFIDSSDQLINRAQIS